MRRNLRRSAGDPTSNTTCGGREEAICLGSLKSSEVASALNARKWAEKNAKKGKVGGPPVQTRNRIFTSNRREAYTDPKHARVVLDPTGPYESSPRGTSARPIRRRLSRRGICTL